MYRLAFPFLLLTIACGGSSTEATGGAGGPGGVGGPGGAGGAGGRPVVDVGETCEAFCAKGVVECDAFVIDEPTCRQACEAETNNEYQHAEACGTAFQAIFECATRLGCEEFQAWIDRSPADAFPCRPELVIYNALITTGICLPAE
jgi:hypothetical protein